MGVKKTIQYKQPCTGHIHTNLLRAHTNHQSKHTSRLHTVQTVEEAGVRMAPLSNQTFTPENTLH